MDGRMTRAAASLRLKGHLEPVAGCDGDRTYDGADCRCECEASHRTALAAAAAVTGREVRIVPLAAERHPSKARTNVERLRHERHSEASVEILETISREEILGLKEERAVWASRVRVEYSTRVERGRDEAEAGARRQERAVEQNAGASVRSSEQGHTRA